MVHLTREPLLSTVAGQFCRPLVGDGLGIWGQKGKHLADGGGLQVCTTADSADRIDTFGVCRGLTCQPRQKLKVPAKPIIPIHIGTADKIMFACRILANSV